MNLIRLSIDRPTAVISAVIMIVLFGWLALKTIPIQLTPDVNRPVVSIRTSWPGAAPVEIEREITNRQEDVLKGITGLEHISSSSSRGSARVTLEFSVGTKMDKALLLVANRLDRVNSYPDEADKPTLSLSGSEDRPIAWFIVTRKPGNTRPIHEYGDLLEEVLTDRFERIAGVSEVSVRGMTNRQLQIVVSPQRLAAYHLTVADLVTALRRANASFSAGDIEEGKRSYIVRTEAELNSIDAVRSVVVRTEEAAGSGGVGRVSIGDIAKVSFAYPAPRARIRQLGEDALAFNITRETGANVIETMKAIRKQAEAIKTGVLDRAGLKMVQVYDETVYISSAVDLVRQNIWIGGSLAALVLAIFLRSIRATLIISLAIPVSVIGSFVAMAALGRSINVISLAGLAFAVGMVVDAAIVVLENIFRLREQGMPGKQAAYEGARQVWGAVFVSVLTTVMVFIPLLVLQLEVGQLFRDIAVAISVSVILSMLVSITVIPSLSARMLANQSTIWHLPLPGIDQLGRGFAAMVSAYVRIVCRWKLLAMLVVAGIIAAMSVFAWALIPPRDYLPNGNRNLMFGILVPPPGYNLKTMEKIAHRFEDLTRPMWESEVKKSGKKLKTTTIKRFFFVTTRTSTFIGLSATDPARAHELVMPMNILIANEPDMLGGVSQSSLFGRGLGSTRQVDLVISGSKLNEIYQVAGRAAGMVSKVFPRKKGNRMRPVPALSQGAPELRIIPNRSALADAGISAREFGQAIDAFNDGLRVSEITIGNNLMNLVLKGETRLSEQTQEIDNLPVVTRNGQIIPVSSLATIKMTSGPTQIRHKERQRVVTLQITPRGDIPLEEALAIVQEKIIDVLQSQGLPDDVMLGMSGAADKLNVTWNAMQRQLLIALIIVYLVMAVLFESFVYPIIIMTSVPLAAAGGIGGLLVLNMMLGGVSMSGLFSGGMAGFVNEIGQILKSPQQTLDMLTMLGFVILIGIVVNNAILLVHQTLIHVRQDKMAINDAILEASRNRIRPIFMSTLTSVFGMLPLVILPGAGSELYRGLGSVVVGGLTVSAFLTIIVIPPMLALVGGIIEKSE